MGFTTAAVNVSNPENPKKSRKIKLVVDTGAMYSIISITELKALGIKPLYKRKFTLADGRKTERDVGVVLYKYNDYLGHAPVIFGKGRDQELLGVTALEAMGLQVDPTTKKLIPAELFLLQTA